MSRWLLFSMFSGRLRYHRDTKRPKCVTVVFRAVHGSRTHKVIAKFRAFMFNESRRGGEENAEGTVFVLASGG